MATLTKSPATSGDPRNLVWHSTDNGASWYSSWTLSVSQVIKNGDKRIANTAKAFEYEMPHQSVIITARPSVASVALDYDGAVLD